MEPGHPPPRDSGDPLGRSHDVTVDPRVTSADASLGTPPLGSGELPRLADPVPLGAGGMGEVVSVRDRSLRRRVAMKVLRGDGQTPPSPDRLARFVREAQVKGQLEHPNIVPVHDLATDERGRPYFTMKLVRGRSLQDVISAGDEPLPELLRILLAACDAVAFAHDRGVVHRDLKPANVMVGDFGEVQVMDWGVAKVLRGGAEADTSDAGASVAEEDEPRGDATATLLGSVVGTPAYMAPEQARGDSAAATGATDVYALGAILYAILTGEPPVEAPDTARVLYRVAHGEIPWPCERSPDRAVPRDLDAVVRRAMALEPAARYPSVLAFAAEVRAFLEGRLVDAADYDVLDVVSKWVRRHRTVSVVSGVAAVLLALMGTAFVRNQAVERRRAVEAEGRAVAALEEARTAQSQEARERRRAEDTLAWSRFVEALALADAGRLRDADVRLDVLEAEDARRAVAPLAVAAARWDLALRGLDVETLTLDGGRGAARAACLDAGGRRAYVGSEDGSLVEWDAATGARLRSFAGDAHAVTALALSPDATRLAAGDASGGVRLVALDTGAVADRWALDGEVESLAWAPDGSRLAASTAAGTVHVLAPGTAALLAIAARPPCPAAFLAGGARLAVATHPASPARPRVDVRDATTGALLATCCEHADAIRALAATRDGALLVTGSEDKTLAAWRAATGRRERTFAGHEYGVKAAALATDGRTLASGSYDRTVRTWDLATGAELRRFTGHGDRVTSVAASDLGAVVLSGSRDGTAKVWSTAPWRGLRAWDLDAGPGAALAVAPDGGRVAVTSAAAGALLVSLDATTPEVLAPPSDAADRLAVAFDGTGERLLTVRCGGDCAVAAWTPGAGWSQVATLESDGQPWDAVGLSRDAALAWAWTRAGGGTLRLVDVRSREIRELAGVASRVAACRLDAGAEAATCALTDGTLLFVAWQDGGRRDARADLEAPRASFTAAFAQDGRHALLGDGESGAVAWVEVATGRVAASLAGVRSVLAVDVSDDGRCGALGTDGGLVTVVDLAAGREVASLPAGGNVGALRFLPDGRGLVVLDRAGRLSLWDFE
jgi:WD40 repeat protein